MPGSTIDKDKAIRKISKRVTILNAAENPIRISNTIPSIAKTYYGVKKNAYIFDIGLVGRYFQDGNVNATNYADATHLLVVEGAHLAHVPGDPQNFTENTPTVILVPVRHLQGLDYRLVGNPTDASIEWPESYILDTIEVAHSTTTVQSERANQIQSEKSKSQETEKINLLPNDVIFRIEQVNSLLAFGDDSSNQISGVESIFDEKADSVPNIPTLRTSRGISIDDAKNYLEKVAKIKDDFREIIFEAIEKSGFPKIKKDEAKRYYTEFRDAYVFSKESIESVAKQMKNDTDHLIFFEGVRDDVKPGSTLFAKPTLIGFVYNSVGNDMVRLENDPRNPSGIEYPPLLNLEKIEDGIPKIIEPGSINSFLSVE